MTHLIATRGILLSLILLGSRVASAAETSTNAPGEPKSSQAAATGGSYRAWTDAGGNRTVEARLADFQDGKVRLRKKNGQTIAFALEKLSKTDQEYVGVWQALKRKYPWLDTNAPFDVVAFLAPIPKDENAALLYPDALFEFSGDVGDLFPPEEQQRRSPIGRKRLEEYFRLDEAWRKNAKSVNPAEVDAWIAEYESGFKKLALAQARPRCAFPCPVGIVAPTGHAQACRYVAGAVVYRNRRDLARGDFERPIQGIELVLRLSRDIRHRSETVCQFVSIAAIDRMCCDTMLLEVLLAPGLRREHCDRLLAALAGHEAEAIDPFLESQQVEYLRTRKLLYDYLHRSDLFDVKTLREQYGAQGPLVFPFGPLTMIWTLSGSGGAPRLALEKMKLLTEADARGGTAAKSAEFTRRVMAMTEQDLAHEVEAVNRVFANILDLKEVSSLQRSRACKDPKLVDPLREAYVAVFFEPEDFAKIPVVCLRVEAALRGAQCLVALRRWQLEHPEPPQDLATLVKAAGMKGVPIDPYCDEPLRMTVVQGAPLVYSVGPDGKDDRGLVPWDLAADHPGDYIFRLTPPQNR